MKNKKRKIDDVIRGMIGDGLQGTQLEMKNRLVSLGYKVDQSTVSRSLRKVGAVKTVIDGKPGYLISQPTIPTQSPDLSNLITEITSNESMIVIKTKPASAMFVAGFLDHHKPGDILGTVAGDDTIIIVPKSVKQIGISCHNLKEFLGKN